MKLEFGMYVRHKRKGIFKITNSKIQELNKIPYIGVSGNYTVIELRNIVKASHNIIDLIEVGDYVNGEKIGYIDDCDGAVREYYYDYEDASIDVGHWFEEIKSIVTKEQFENMAYKVGD